MRLIYQIGRLDPNMSELKFSIDGKEFSSFLSSLALKEFFNKEAKVILIYPVSLPINERLLSSDIDPNFKQKIKETLDNPDIYFNDPISFFKNHPHTKQSDDFFIIHSLGEFRGILFEATFDVIVLEILIDMITRYMEEEFTDLYVDISSGLNIYVSALLEATRNFVVFQKLQSWNEEDNFTTRIVFTDPIFGSSKNIYEIHKDYELKLKVFFSSPISRKDCDSYNLSRKISNNNRELKRKFQKIFKNFLLCFSSIKNNAPLALYTFEFDSQENIKMLIKEMISVIKNQINFSWIKAPALNKDDYLKALMSLSFYIGIVKILNQMQINTRQEVDIESIEETFYNVYNIFNLPLYSGLLKHEIRNIVEGKGIDKIPLKEKLTDEWKPLADFFSLESREIVPRNFLAHAGFEKNIVELKKYNERILVRYKPDLIHRVREILINS